MNQMVNTETKIWNRTFISVFLTNALMYMAQQMVQPLITSYVKSIGATAAIIGIIASAYTWTAILMKVISAPAIDTYNKKYLLCGGMAVMGIAFTGFALFGSIPSVMAFRLIQGCGQAFTTSCCLALATDALPRNKLGQGIGIFALAQSICQAIGPTLGKYLQGVAGFKVTFATAAGFMFAGAIFSLLISNSFTRTKKFKISLKSMFAIECIVPVATQFFLAFAYCLINSYLYIFAESQGVVSNSIGLFFTIYAGTLLITRPLVGKLTDKYGSVRVVIPAIGMFALSFLLISISTSLWMFFVAAFISAFGYGACTPALQALCMRLVTPDRRGAASCSNYLGTDFGFLLGPLFASLIIERFGYPAMWRFMLIPLFFAALIMFVNRGRIADVKKQ